MPVLLIYAIMLISEQFIKLLISKSYIENSESINEFCNKNHNQVGIDYVINSFDFLRKPKQHGFLINNSHFKNEQTCSWHIESYESCIVFKPALSYVCYRA